MSFSQTRLCRSFGLALLGILCAFSVSAQDITAPQNFSETTILASVDVTGTGSNGVNGKTGARGYYTCSKMKWGEACADIYKWGKAIASHSKAGGNAPGGTSTTDTTNSNTDVVEVSGDGDLGVYSLVVTSLATAQIWSSEGSSGLSRTAALNGGAAFQVTLKHTDGGTVVIDAPAGTTLEQLTTLINANAGTVPGTIPGDDPLARYTATIEASQQDNLSAVTDVLSITGLTGAGNNFTVAIDWGNTDTSLTKISLATPVATQVGTDPTKAVDADNPAVTVNPVGMTSSDAVYTVDGTPGSSTSNTITVGGLSVDLLASGATTLTVENLSSAVGNGDVGNAGTGATGHTQSYTANTINTPGATAFNWNSVGGNAGFAQKGGQGGQGGTGGQALADTAPIIFFMPFPPITAPSTQSIAMNGGVGGNGSDGGHGGVGGLGGVGGPLSLTLNVQSVTANTIASLTSTGGQGGTGGIGGNGGRGGTGGAGHASKESSNLVMNAIAATGGAGGLGGNGGVGGQGNQGGTGGAVAVDATVASASLETGFELRSVGGLGGVGGQGGAGGIGGTGGAGAAIVYEADGGGLSENTRAAVSGVTGGTGGVGNTGGEAGTGGTGGMVSVLFGGNINTTKSAITAVSEGGVGGLGGNGGTGGQGGTGGEGDAAGAGVNIAHQTIASRGGNGGAAGTGGTGGKGSTGGKGGNVSIELTDPDGVITSGQTAIVAQSLGGVGGKGGNGGNGGKGGTGGDGDWVRWTTGVSISEDFDLSLLIKHYADQSAGGNGGKGGSNGSGGDGGDGGDAGTVTVTNHQTIRTTGTSNASGIAAQSFGAIGGEGGDVGTVGAGGDGGAGGDSCLSHSSNSCVFGAKAASGTSGAAGSVNDDAEVGRTSYVGGDSGAVNVTNHGAIETAGSRSSAISALSIGGVQGLADFDPFAVNWDPMPIGAQQSNSGNVSVTNTGNLMTAGDESAGILALSHATDGSSGYVSITTSGDIATSGDKSSAIIAQSNVLDEQRTDAPDSTGGKAGNVSVNVTGGDISMQGADAAAIIAQSYTNSEKTDAGDVSVKIGDATITGSGQSSPGALVQASAEATAGKAGDVTVENAGSVECVADNCVAFELKSKGKTPADNGNLSLTNSGTIEGGKGGNAVVLTGGKTNRVVNENPASGEQATIRTKGGVSDVVIVGTDGDDEIINRNGALLEGSVDLGGGNNSLLNDVGSTYNSGNTIDLGGGTFTNNGTFSPGGIDQSMNPGNFNGRTTINGDYVQGSTGNLVINLDFQTGAAASDYADILYITGDAYLDGLLTLEPMTGAGKPGDFTLAILNVGGGFTGPGLTLNSNFANGTPSTTAVFTPTTYSDGNTQYISYKIDYRPDGLTPNAGNVGAAVNNIQNAGVPAYQVIADELLRLATIADLQKAYDSLSGEGVSASQQATLGASAHRSSNLMSGMNDFAFCAAAAGDEQSECNQLTRYWLNGSGLTSYNRGTDNSASTKNASNSLQAGAEHRLSSQALIGFAMDLSTTGFDVADRSTSGKAEGLSVSAYGVAWTDSGFYAKGLLTSGAYFNKTGRIALNRFVGGHYESYALGSNVEFGARIGDNQLGVMPYAGMGFDVLFQPAWSEDNNVYGNLYRDQHIQSQRANLGFAFNAEVPMSETQVGQITANVMYERELSAARGNVVESLAAAGFDWRTDGLSAPEDKVKLDLGLSFNPAENIAVSLKASHVIYAGGSSTAGTISLSGKF